MWAGKAEEVVVGGERALEGGGGGRVEVSG